MQHQLSHVQNMSQFEKVDALTELGEMDEKAAKLIVEMFSGGKASPEMREVIEAIKGELTRNDLATKSDLIAAVSGLASKTELDAAVSGLASKTELDAAVSGLASKTELELAIANLKLEMLDRMNVIESNLRLWIVGVGAVAAALANLDKLAALVGG